MSPITHLLASWTVASIPRLERRDRAIITLAGISPDIDGVGILAELATRHTEQPLLWWSKYHHVIGHNLAFGISIFITAAAIAKRRLLTAGLAFFVFQGNLCLSKSVSFSGRAGPVGTLYNRSGSSNADSTFNPAIGSKTQSPGDPLHIGAPPF
jgi:hypothetical protein